MTAGTRTEVALALDVRAARAMDLVEELGDQIDIAKIGLTLYAEGGPSLVADIVERRPVFLDLKLHDIPHQVGGAAAMATAMGVSYLTIHSSGGAAMIEAAVASAGRGGSTKILGVTVLTSLDDGDLDSVGVPDDAGKQVLRLAELALGAGAHGLVCSPLEVASIRERFGPEPILVVPGIRPEGSDPGDQKRTLTPAEAAEAGADVIVVGRPITAAANPREAAAAIKAELA